jgi:hypothetical protein
MPTSPSLKLRRILWPDGSTSTDPKDYDVIDDRGERIGRMYRVIAIGGGYAWRWSVYGMATYDKPPNGLEPTREKAMAAFKAAWRKCKPRGRGA